MLKAGLIDAVAGSALVLSYQVKKYVTIQRLAIYHNVVVESSHLCL